MINNVISSNNLRVPPANRLAIEVGVDARRINEITPGSRRITADTAWRLARYFGVSPQFWLGLQAEYDLDVAMDNLGNRLESDAWTLKIQWQAGTRDRHWLNRSLLPLGQTIRPPVFTAYILVGEL